MYMEARCGAWQVGAAPERGAIEFRLFFPSGTDPRIAEIRVGGTFQSQLGGTDWDLARGPELTRDDSDPHGIYWTATTATVPAGFYEYKYRITFDDGAVRIVTDPCARYGGYRDDNAAVVVGGSTPDENVVRPLRSGRRPLEDLVVYELMIDDFTAEYRVDRAPLDAVTDKLDELAGMGVTAILFMPWTAWYDRDFDWGYGPFQYFAVEARYADAWGRPEEKLSWLKRLVSACHDRDIHVIMDGVFNHTGPAFPYPQFYLDPRTCPFTHEAFGGKFPGLLDLDFHNECTNEFILDVCTYWIGTFGIDGIRFDNTVNFIDPEEPTHGLPGLLGGLRKWLDAAGEQNFSLTLEHIDVSAATVTNDTAATSFWDNSLYYLARDGLEDHRLPAGLVNALNNRRWLKDGKVPTLYVSNHDHSQPGWFVAVGDLNSGVTGSWWRLQPWLIALFTGTGVPLIPNGQEFGSSHYLPEDDHGTGRRVLSRPLQWKSRNDAVGSTLVALHRTLATARAHHAALRSAHIWPEQQDGWQTQFDPDGFGADLDRQAVVYHRWAALPDGRTETVIVVLNFSDAEQRLTVPFPSQGRWTDLLGGFDGAPWEVEVRGSHADVPVGSHWGRLLNHVG
jgi:pullulanase/glycogen debranching enzyme